MYYAQKDIENIIVDENATISDNMVVENATIDDVKADENAVDNTVLLDTTTIGAEAKSFSEQEAELEEMLNVKLGDYFEADETINLTKSISGNAFFPCAQPPFQYR